MCLIIRPHPLFFRTMQEKGGWDLTDESTFRETIRNSANMALHEEPHYDDVFWIADALMTDVGSFLLEFLPLEKPILYLCHPQGLGMNDDESLTDVLYTARNGDDLSAFMTMVEKGEDPLRAQRTEAIPHYLHGLGSHIGSSICEHIFQSIKAEPARKMYTEEAPDDDVQQLSEEYWTQATTTFLAPEEYYQKKEIILKTALSKLSKISGVIDIGCGDGRFTFTLAQHADFVSAYDISPHLIASAEDNAQRDGVTNVSFSISEIEDILPFRKYDLVSVMGVTSCIIDDLKFIRLLDRIKYFCNPGGTFLTVDTLSMRSQQLASDGKGYYAKYRSIDSYRRMICERGFTPVEETIIKQDLEKGLLNALFVYRLGDG